MCLNKKKLGEAAGVPGIRDDYIHTYYTARRIRLPFCAPILLALARIVGGSLGAAPMVIASLTSTAPLRRAIEMGNWARDPNSLNDPADHRS